MYLVLLAMLIMNIYAYANETKMSTKYNYEIIGCTSGNSCYSLLEHIIFNVYIAHFLI